MSALLDHDGRDASSTQLTRGSVSWEHETYGLECVTELQ